MDIKLGSTCPLKCWFVEPGSPAQSSTAGRFIPEPDRPPPGGPTVSWLLGCPGDRPPEHTQAGPWPVRPSAACPLLLGIVPFSWGLVAPDNSWRPESEDFQLQANVAAS